MYNKPRWDELVGRINNFNWDVSDNGFKKFSKDNADFFTNSRVFDEILQLGYCYEKAHDRKDLLKQTIAGVYELVTESYDEYKIFHISNIINLYPNYRDAFSEKFNFDVNKNPGLTSYKMIRVIGNAIYNDIFDVCLYNSLCSFLNYTKKIKSLTIEEFIYKNSPHRYSEKTINGKDNLYYFDFDFPDKTSEGCRYFYNTEYNYFAQSRSRVHKGNYTFIGNNRHGIGIPKDMEYEVAFLYNITSQDGSIRDTHPNIVDTYKRIGNLFNEVNDFFDPSKYSENLKKGKSEKDPFKTFSSKLKKINYKNVVELYQYIISMILKNKKYYGVTLYKAERNLAIYRITHGVASLLNCQNEDEEKYILINDAILGAIHFPKLYDYFSMIEDYEVKRNCAGIFDEFLGLMTTLICLLIDLFVDNGLFEDDWEEFFLNEINEMASSVFYDTQTIEFPTAPEAEKKYRSFISEPVKISIELRKEQYIRYGLEVTNLFDEFFNI